MIGQILDHAPIAIPNSATREGEYFYPRTTGFSCVASASWNSTTPPSAEVHRASILTEIGVSPTGDRLGRTRLFFSMVGGRSPGLGLASTSKSYVRSRVCATPTALLLRRPPS